jgi:hypothetical protein
MRFSLSNTVRRFQRFAGIAVLVAGFSLASSSTASATAILALQEDGGVITTVATAASLSALIFNSTYGNFTVTFFGSSSVNGVNQSRLSGSNTEVQNSNLLTAGSHTLNLWISSQDYTLPAGTILGADSGMSGTRNTGTLTPTFQAWADQLNNLGGNPLLGGTVAACGAACADFTTGNQVGSFTGNTFDTGSAAGLFTNLAGPYSMTTVTRFVMGAGGSANFSNHENMNAVPEPASLLLLGSGFVGLAARARRRLRKS